MKLNIKAVLVALLMAVPMATAWADDDSKQYDEAIKAFQEAGESGNFFKTAYGYAVFPNIAKGAVGVGGAYGKGRVYKQGKYVGDSKMFQASIGFALGGQVYSMIIFFENESAFNDFTKGEFEFSAQATAVAITAGASAQTTTAGSSAGASGGRKDSTDVGKYRKGMAIFTVARGGLMYEASLAGMKFTYKPKGK